MKAPLTGIDLQTAKLKLLFTGLIKANCKVFGSVSIASSYIVVNLGLYQRLLRLPVLLPNF